jgi:iron complex outermembrane receptor protein
MTRSRQRKLKRNSQSTHLKIAGVSLAAAVAASLQPVLAAETNSEGVLESVIVTAQKRSENLQEVPLSIQAIGTERLEELHVKGFEDYVRYLPTV